MASRRLIHSRLPHAGLHSAPFRRSPSRLSYNVVLLRHASSSSSSTDSQLLSGFRAVLLGTSIALSLGVTYLYATDTRASVLHQYIVPPLLRAVYPDAEDAHHATTDLLQTLYRLNLHPRERPSSSSTDSTLSVPAVFGEWALSNPLGISAGLDKDGALPDALFALGAAVVEVGGCTPFPQPGNPRPRVFRVPALRGLVNRYGLNSAGADAMASRLRTRARDFAAARRVDVEDLLAGAAVDARTGRPIPPGSLAPGRLLLVQVAKAKETDERDVGAVAADYAYCVSRLAPYADVLVVNVSSPNTPGLRDLQASGPLTAILQAVVAEAERSAVATRGGDKTRRPKVMVKVSPDEDGDAQVDGVVRAVWAAGVDGVIVGNTTKRRDVRELFGGGWATAAPELTAALLPVGDHHALFEEMGGFSGPAMFERTLGLVKKYRAALDAAAFAVPAPPVGGGTVVAAVEAESRERQEQKVIFATGGIASGGQALQVLDAGASVAMVYTGLVYGGAGTVTRMKQEMRSELSSARG